MPVVCAVTYALVAVVAVPWNVVAVITLLPIVIPEPVERVVPPEDAVFKTVPIKYLVAVVASVLTSAADEATAGMSVVKAIVLPEPEPVPPLNTFKVES